MPGLIIGNARAKDRRHLEGSISRSYAGASTKEVIL